MVARGQAAQDTDYPAGYTHAAVELFETGEYEVTERDPVTGRARLVRVAFGPEHLRQMARNYRLSATYPGLAPALVIGHEERQSLNGRVLGTQPWRKAFGESGLPMQEWGDALTNTGTPAAGWVVNPFVRLAERPDGQRRHVLYGYLRGVHPKIAALINQGHYAGRSAEVLPRPPHGAPPGCHGAWFRRLAVLGGWPPNLKQLAPWPPVKFADAAPPRFAWVPSCGVRCGGAVYLFSEAVAVDREQMTQTLLKAGWTQQEIDQVKDDAILALIVQHEVTELQGGGGDAGAGAAAAAPADAGAGATPPDPETMIQDLVAAGEDEATLRAMSPEELTALWQEKVGGAQMADPKKPVTVAAGANPVREFAAVSAGVVRLQRQVRAIGAATAARERVEKARLLSSLKRQAAEHIERWTARKYVTPGEVDPRSKEPNVYHRLMAAAEAVADSSARVRKFGDLALDDFEAVVREIDNRKENWAARNTREAVADPATDPRADRFRKVREQAEAERAARTPAGPTLEERLRMVPLRGRR
jgi:hypothetical protein